MYREAPIKNGMFDYIEFTRILKHGAKDKDEQWREMDCSAGRAPVPHFSRYYLTL